jgi:hypothetical protein
MIAMQCPRAFIFLYLTVWPDAISGVLGDSFWWTDTTTKSCVHNGPHAALG